MDLRQRLLSAYDKQQWRSIRSIADAMPELERVLSAIALSDHIKQRIAEQEFEHKLTAEDKRALAAAARVIGNDRVLFDISSTPVIDAPDLVAYLLSNLDEMHAFKAQRACINAIKAGQNDIAMMIIEWLIRMKYDHVEIYGIFISAYADRIMSRKIFDLIVKSCYIVPILNQARVGLMDFHSNFLALVAGLDNETKIKVFEKM